MRASVVSHGRLALGVKLAETYHRRHAAALGRLAIVLDRAPRVGLHNLPLAIELTERKRGYRLSLFCQGSQFVCGRCHIPRHALSPSLHFGEPDCGLCVPPTGSLPIIVLRQSKVRHWRPAFGVIAPQSQQRGNAAVLGGLPVVMQRSHRIGWDHVSRAIKVPKRDRSGGLSPVGERNQFTRCRCYVAGSPLAPRRHFSHPDLCFVAAALCRLAILVERSGVVRRQKTASRVKIGQAKMCGGASLRDRLPIVVDGG
ncbi:hypothetical protein D9M68_392230 [compost metagenome]